MHMSISKKSFPWSTVCASHSRTLSIIVFFGGLQSSDRYQKESYACWFLSLYFESCCIEKPHIFQPFSLFNKKALPRIFAYFCTIPYLTPCSIFGHIWPSGSLMRIIGENRLPSLLALAKNRFNISEKFFQKWVLERYGNLPKENNWRVRGTLRPHLVIIS